MDFHDWVIYIDSARDHARRIRAHVEKLSDHTPSRGEIASMESLCRRFLDAVPRSFVETRPRDVMPYEWEEDPFAIIRARLSSLQAHSEERSANTTLWLTELKVAADDLIEGWDWFNSRIER